MRNGVAITPPITSNVLEGITRRTVIQLLRDELGIEVVERQIDRTELFIADEAFSCGTGYQVAAVTKVDFHDVGSGTMGPITKQLRDVYFKLVRGELPKYKGWLVPVYASVREAVK